MIVAMDKLIVSIEENRDLTESLGELKELMKSCKQGDSSQEESDALQKLKMVVDMGGRLVDIKGKIDDKLHEIEMIEERRRMRDAQDQQGAMMRSSMARVGAKSKDQAKLPSRYRAMQATQRRRWVVADA